MSVGLPMRTAERIGVRPATASISSTLRLEFHAKTDIPCRAVSIEIHRICRVSATARSYWWDFVENVINAPEHGHAISEVVSNSQIDIGSGSYCAVADTVGIGGAVARLAGPYEEDWKIVRLPSRLERCIRMLCGVHNLQPSFNCYWADLP
jgi:hypothetical protein